MDEGSQGNDGDRGKDRSEAEGEARRSRPVGECWLQEMNLEHVCSTYEGQDVRRIDLMIGEKDCWGLGIGSAVIRLLTQFAFAGERGCLSRSRLAGRPAWLVDQAWQVGQAGRQTRLGRQTGLAGRPGYHGFVEMLLGQEPTCSLAGGRAAASGAGPWD